MSAASRAGIDSPNHTEAPRLVCCRIADLEGLLTAPERVLELVEKEAREVADTFGRPRRSIIVQPPERDSESISAILNEPSIIVFSKRGYIKRMRADTIEVQNRNGRGTPMPPSVYHSSMLSSPLNIVPVRVKLSSSIMHCAGSR